MGDPEALLQHTVNHEIRDGVRYEKVNAPGEMFWVAVLSPEEGGRFLGRVENRVLQDNFKFGDVIVCEWTMTPSGGREYWGWEAIGIADTVLVK